MFSKFILKEIEGVGTERELSFLDTIKNSKNVVWVTAVMSSNGSIQFVKDKQGAGFFTAKLKKFPSIVEEISKQYPDVVVENSYVTKLTPNYNMLPHIDKNRKTAILMPLGKNKGEIVYSVCGIPVHTHVYRGPIISRVDITHGANNTSDSIRYALTLELPGTLADNRTKYRK